MRKLFFVAIALLSVLSLHAQSPPYEKVLVPVYHVNPIQGAYGSIWDSHLWIRNEGTEQVTIRTTCFITCSPLPGIPLDPGQSITNPNLLQGGTPLPRPGAFVLIAPGSQLRVKLHIRDRTRQSQTMGTEMPTVRHDEFLSGTSSLLPVPTDDRFRVMLRLYTRDQGSVARFRVRIYALQDASHGLPHVDLLLAETEVTGSTATGIDPGYAEIPALVQAFPAVAVRDLVRVDIQPLEPTSRYYAFITVTNNETQHVTTVTP